MNGATALMISAQEGHLDVVGCLVEKLGADVNQLKDNGSTALMFAAGQRHDKTVVYLLRHGADPKVCAPGLGTAADISNRFGAPAEQTAYLEAKTHCSNPSCGGASGFKKSTGCKEVRYCGEKCQLLHWPAHKVECKEAAKNEAAKKK
jgi:hypothetical protein